MTQNRFIPLHSTQSGAIPTASGMFVGELAVNTADGKLFTRHEDQVVALNDTTNFVSSSQQILDVINGSQIIPVSVTSSFFGPTEGNKVVLTTTTSATTIISSSIKSGIFNATEVVDPPIPMVEFSGVSVEYTAQRETAVRSGILLASWSGSSVTYTDVSNTDVGDSSDLSFNFVKIDNNILLRAYSQGIGAGTWTVQFLFKMFPNLL
jgi:hypothetical protein